MTKEDAIDIIKSECYVFNPLNFDRSTMVNTALDMAVKTLEFDLDKHDEEVIKNTVETLWGEPCDDAISRQAVLDACDQSINIFDATDRIKELPSVQPMQRVGRWIKKETEFITPSRYYPIQEIVSTCSICNTRYIGIHKDFKYCPNCGCRMVESEEE